MHPSTHRSRPLIGASHGSYAPSRRAGDIHSVCHPLRRPARRYVHAHPHNLRLFVHPRAHAHNSAPVARRTRCPPRWLRKLASTP
ncbi:hypothetical protein HYPSUDRAFT_65324 [Hypholoma sublateritium FD-334 SS-4]|uniref:Uncharacterized protein n=1 Tax=Hypholoma sublateritium (strain FD-334 SS-4) TaxID=945553 RepID=A0A0D2MLQ1_HYPSF|nr:hypothetical protein HYPSUDRAFT_65324 [Hypholoma sublateritium FD-334 SS-4]